MEQRDFHLQMGQQLRVQISFKQSLGILLESGRAEKFGEELPPGTWRYFKGPDNFAIFTWHGCKLRVQGECTSIYTNRTESPMSQYLVAHGTANRLRYEACRVRRLGPKILVAGGPCCGKSALCKILLNYASKCGWRPVFVQLDVTNNEMFVPGCISAASYTQNDWDPILAYFYGHSNFQLSNIDHYKALLTQLANQVLERLVKEHQYSSTYHQESYDPRNNSYASGCIINFPPFLDMNLSQDILNFIIGIFQIDLVYIIDQERLVSSMQERGIQPLQLSKLGSVVSLQVQYKNRMQINSLNNYFALFQIHQVQLGFSEIQIYRVTVSSAPSSALTYGDNQISQGLIISQIAPTQEALLNAILGIIIDQEDILRSSIYGLVHVVEVDEHQQILKVLTPGVLPSKKFIVGSLKKLK